eukprot:CAMPEP_0174695530 /NCGR_PEP_ID=MMETSP1094-20130205/1891_1 /TAXON_ID=156173 /ORGANISM="Chrysochromulina brevifilum, Strain UTEX LB 985" /LENGTH=34 /DNA_ID= /DNA_START= /DNA_END= /DNA_ORIENTATION=
MTENLHRTVSPQHPASAQTDLICGPDGLCTCGSD